MNFNRHLVLLALLALLAAPPAAAQADTENDGDAGGRPAGDAPVGEGAGESAADDGAPAPVETDAGEPGVAEAESGDAEGGEAQSGESEAGEAAVDESGSGESEAGEAAVRETGSGETVSGEPAAGADDAGTDATAPTAAPAPQSGDTGEAPAPGEEGITVLDQVVPVAEDPEQPAAEGAPGETGVETGPPAEPFEDPALSDEERLGIAFVRFQEFREAGMLDEAENAAKRAVEISINASGPGSNDTAKALTNLATVQYDTRNYDAAKQNFQSAIDIYTENEDRLSGRLVNPLRGLGAAQLESGRPDEALETYRQAVHITHVNEGPHNLDQLPILEAVAETHLRMGALEEARDAQDMIYALNLRHLDGDTMNLVPPLMRRAAWQRRTGYVLDERATYRRVIRIIEEEKGPDDIALIEPLTKLAESYFYVDISGTDTFQQATIASGEIYFKRAIRIAEEHPDADWQVEARTLLALADYYNFRSDQGRARRAYGDVWDLLSTDAETEDQRLQMRYELLEQVHALNEDPIPQYVADATLADRQQADKGIREGVVIASYDVSARGRTSRTSIVEVTPPQFTDMEDEVVRELRDRIFRPRFVEGEPVDTTDLVLTHRFFYLQSELDRRLGAGDDASNDEGGDE